jgi:hypothetical protein
MVFLSPLCAPHPPTTCRLSAEPVDAAQSAINPSLNPMERTLILLTAFLLAPQNTLRAAEPPPNPATSHVIVHHTKEAARNGEASLIELRDGVV